jgi:hypothetical protein
MNRNFSANNYVHIEAKIKDRAMQPLAKNAKPIIKVTVPAGLQQQELGKDKGEFEMHPRPGGEWDGYFFTRFLVKSPGEYKVEVKVKETNDSAYGKFVVKEANPELDNTRPDFALMYEMASDADEVIKRVGETSAVARDLRQRLSAGKPVESTDKPAGEKKAADPNQLKLVFSLANADLIPSCMVSQSKTVQNRGPISDLWDDGIQLPPSIMGTEEKPAKISYVLIAAVLLLGIEWLTRKLLRLA